jgi:glycosyltransferase involved in cell wall biosynthesis
MRLTRVIAKLEPGGAQLGVLRLGHALRGHGIETRVLAGYATREGRRQFAAAGLATDVWEGGDPSLQHEARVEFAEWLQPRLTGADLVHAHMFGAWWAAAHAVAPGTPLVASEHNALRWPSDPATADLRAALLRVDLLFAHGPSTRALFTDLGVGPDRLRTGASAIEGLDARPRRALPSPRIVFAGRLHEEKGPDLLVRALALLDHPPPTLILGAGPLDRPLRRLASRLGVSRAIRFCGWREDAPRYIAGSSVCVVPSRRDAWSQTAVIAMGLGVPVVATAVEGLPATIGSNRGVLVAPEDPEALADGIDGVLRGEIVPDRADARAYAQRFLPERVAAAYAAEYGRVLSDARAKAA